MCDPDGNEHANSPPIGKNMVQHDIPTIGGWWDSGTAAGEACDLEQETMMECWVLHKETIFHQDQGEET